MRAFTFSANSTKASPGQPTNDQGPMRISMISAGITEATAVVQSPVRGRLGQCQRLLGAEPVALRRADLAAIRPRLAQRLQPLGRLRRAALGPRPTVGNVRAGRSTSAASAAERDIVGVVDRADRLGDRLAQACRPSRAASSNVFALVTCRGL